MKRPVVYQRFGKTGSERLLRAQAQLEKSIIGRGLDPLAFPAPEKGLALFGDCLARVRSVAEGQAFVWCNTDVILTADPFDVPDPEIVYGFNRRDIPSGTICTGVDMIYIPIKHWDEYLSRDVPSLYLGASYVDWWIPRAMDKIGAYKILQGYIDHPIHPRSTASGNDADPNYQANFRAYNAWAKRNALPAIPAPPYLIPFVGHSWGLRDAISRFFKNKFHQISLLMS